MDEQQEYFRNKRIYLHQLPIVDQRSAKSLGLIKTHAFLLHCALLISLLIASWYFNSSITNSVLLTVVFLANIGIVHITLAVGLTEKITRVFLIAAVVCTSPVVYWLGAGMWYVRLVSLISVGIAVACFLSYLRIGEIDPTDKDKYPDGLMAEAERRLSLEDIDEDDPRSDELEDWERL